MEFTLEVLGSKIHLIGGIQADRQKKTCPACYGVNSTQFEHAFEYRSASRGNFIGVNVSRNLIDSMRTLLDNKHSIAFFYE